MGTGTIVLVAVAAYFLLQRKSTTTVIPAGQTATGTNSLLQALAAAFKQQPQTQSKGGGSAAPSSGLGIGGASGSRTGIQGDIANLPFVDAGSNNPQQIAINTGAAFHVPGGTWNPNGTFTADTIGSTQVTTVGLDTTQEVPGTGQTVGDLYAAGYSTSDIQLMLAQPPDPILAGTYLGGTQDLSFLSGLGGAPTLEPAPAPVEATLTYPDTSSYFDTGGFTDLGGGADFSAGF